jgi:hypothetical protein
LHYYMPTLLSPIIETVCPFECAALASPIESHNKKREGSSEGHFLVFRVGIRGYRDVRLGIFGIRRGLGAPLGALESVLWALLGALERRGRFVVHELT